MGYENVLQSRNDSYTGSANSKLFALENSFFCLICSKYDNNDCLFNKMIVCFSSFVIFSCLIP